MTEQPLAQEEAMEFWADMNNGMMSNLPFPTGKIWEGVDGPSLVAAASALQLLVENAHYGLRLKRLVAVALRLPDRPRAPKLSPSKIRKLLADPFISGSSVRIQEDPFEGIYVIEVPYAAGSRRVIEGTALGSVRVASSLIKSVLDSNSPALPPEYVFQVKSLSNFLLGISENICEKAGLPRNAVTLEKERNVRVPSAAKIVELSRIVQFQGSELWRDVSAPERKFLSGVLVHSSQEVPAWKEGEFLDENPILRPFVEFGDCITLSSPGDLAACIRHLIISLSYEWNCSEILATSLSAVAFQETQRLLRPFFGASAKAADPSAPVQHIVAPFDTDKTLDVICLVDDLTHYDRSSIFQPWDSTDFSEQIHDIFESGDSVPAKTLRIVVYQGVGRDLAFGLLHSEEPAPTLFVTLEELELILQAPRTDHLTLWYFAQARAQLEITTEIHSFSKVDEFAHYRDRQDSFYFGDGPKPDLVSVESGSAQPFRLEILKNLDMHYVTDPFKGSLVEVCAIHGSDSSPIYAPSGSQGTTLVVKNKSIEVWVRSHQSVQGYDPIEAVAFWWWQLLDSSPEIADTFADEKKMIRVEIMSHTDESVSKDNANPWVESHIPKQGTLQLAFRIPPSPAPDSPPNFYDRLIVASLLQTIAAWVPEMTNKTSLGALLERIAPSGPKKMINFYQEGLQTIISPGDLPKARRVVSAATGFALDSLGEHLWEELGLHPGPIANNERTKVLNKSVMWLTDQLSETIQDLDPTDLLETLVLRDEALTAETSRNRLQLRSLTACFGAQSNLVVESQEQLSRSTGSALASRFIIEYVTGLPARGDLPLTTERYDRMLSLALEIINKGMLSDAIKHNISNTQISILGSRRLGLDVDSDRYHQALTEYETVRATTALDSPMNRVHPATPHSAVTVDEKADALAFREFGFSFTNLADACSRIIELGDEEVTSDVIVLRQVKVVDDLAATLGWDKTQVSNLLNAISLEARAATTAEYWKEGWKVFPWRFNRELSYLRRPIIRVQREDDVVLVIGRRRIWQTPVFWFEQFHTGRLQATTAEMKAELQRNRNAKGRAFEALVSDHMREAGLTRLRTGLKKVGKYDFRNIEGRDIGDIDAIGIDETNKKIYVVEAKDFEVARTPAELSNEIQNLLVGDKSALVRLGQRADWVRNHVSPTLTELGMTSAQGKWQVCPLIVVDERLLSAHISEAEVPILEASELAEHILKTRSTKGRSKRS